MDLAPIVRVEDKQRCVALLSTESRISFWDELWDEDVFNFFLWESQGVLHFSYVGERGFW